MPDIKGEWYEIKAAGSPAADGAAGDVSASATEIYIYGNIGDRWDENSVTAAAFVRDLQAVTSDQITLRINSYGGSVPDGLAIYNALKRHPATCAVQIDGVAISCAGYIAMAGDTVTMAENALLMIHAPWGMAQGNAQAFREQADVLDKYAAALASSYASKSKKDMATCMALVTDGKDHWFTASEAVAEGFADAVGPAIDVAASLRSEFDISRFTPPAAAAVFSLSKEIVMPEVKAPAADLHSAAAAPVAVLRDKTANLEVQAMFAPFMDRDGISAMQTEILTDPAITVAQAQAKLLKKLGDGAEPTARGAAPRIETIADETDKFRAAAVQSIMVRAGVASADAAKDIRANPYRGHKLLDLARASLERARVDTRGMTQMDVVAAAFTQSTSDFPILLENTMHKTLQAAYAVAPTTWNRFCSRGSVSDFRAHPRYRVGSLSNLDAINELGEFKNKTIPDGEKSSITASTKGNIINLSRQAVVNDDLGAFVGLAGSLGRAAARTVEADVYTLLASNPTMSDSTALFHANHGNLAGSAAVISVTSIDLARVGMASQLDVGGNDYLDMRPAVFVCPLALGGLARVTNNAEYDPDTANKLQRPNQVRGLFRDVVDTPRLSGTAWYLFADPQEAPVIEVAFLDGNSDPYLELQNGFDVDGAAYKVRLDFGIAVIDYRGAYKNAGA